jgi:hypothetical protein
MSAPREAEILAEIHSLNIVMMALIQTHPNPTQLKKVLQILQARAESMVTSNILMSDSSSPLTGLYFDHFKIINSMFKEHASKSA